MTSCRSFYSTTGGHFFHCLLNGIQSTILAVLLILAAGGGAAVYFLVLKPKQGKKVPADLDDFDLGDEEEYLTEDEETEEKNE